MKATVLNSLSYGVYAIGVKDGERASACIVNTVVQVAAGQNSLISVSINRDSYSFRCIEKSGIFTVSVLSDATPGTVIGALGFTSGENTNKLDNVRHKVLVEGVPVIKENTCCWFLCKVKSKVEAGTHAVFVAEIIAGSDEIAGKPMTYEHYKTVLKGTSPKKAPTYILPEKTFDKHSGESFVCSVCSYVYSDRSFGFEELPEDWLCPVCKMPKRVFIRR